MRVKRVLAISGSLRVHSSNTAALMAARQLAPENMKIEMYAGLSELPFFNSDADIEPLPAPVAELRRVIGESHALLICSPEYARGVSGVLKNGLDWLVSGPEMAGKPVALINASPRASHADASLRLILDTMSARVIGSASITLPLLGRRLDADGIVRDDELRMVLERALAALNDSLEERSQP